jgi:hypothetical protein
MGNQGNESLRVGALEASKTMQLPVFDNMDIETYLAKAYEHYLNKMIDIGLAGVTLSYGNFEYIFKIYRPRKSILSVDLKLCIGIEKR